MRLTVTDRPVRRAAAADPYTSALRLLAGRDYTVAAITKKLLDRGCDAAPVEQAINRLIAERFLDDRRYVERFVEASQAIGRYVGYRLRQELRRRGAPDALVTAALDGYQDPLEEIAVARSLVARRYAGFSPAHAPDQERRRVAGFLQRRGFRSDTIWKVLGRTISDEEHI